MQNKFHSKRLPVSRAWKQSDAGIMQPYRIKCSLLRAKVRRLQIHSTPAQNGFNNFLSSPIRFVKSSTRTTTMSTSASIQKSTWHGYSPRTSERAFSPMISEGRGESSR